ncbi:ligase-associated DNA damage response DEXH box helicase [Aridibaculum aurantiacum]|uniref:ligase-associated DNA damage response DEXH box helicase n=1 Tax=Aridibaculum aurantiacum TaxID=2810307 RepID=UPI001A979C0E|nr:ligase-associated DNA damage response DEXH box helicase [Aridibaculum aurantiacum]
MPDLKKTPGYKVISQWLAGKDFKPFAFQLEAWQEIHTGSSGLVNAPTGFGKTFSVFLGAIINFINDNPKDYKTRKKNGLQLLWVTPLRALGKDIARAMEEVVAELGMNWQVGIRNGDTDINERARQKRSMPEALIITPESLHLLLAQKGYKETFASLKVIAVDEWHELLGSKRGVQVELAVSKLVKLASANEVKSQNAKGRRDVQVWGISATIGNLEQAKEVLLAPLKQTTSGNSAVAKEERKQVIVKANLKKNIEIESVVPDEIEKFPWAGHLGLNLAEKVVDIIRANVTTLLFINTRGMSERWYQTLLAMAPDLAGALALHHGSIEQDLRIWVEEALHTTKLKAVVCTASLDLGVDFRPVETVIQVGSPKGVARFLQRAGRSGHQPGKVSKIFFVPTHSLELVEAAALKQAMKEEIIEAREPRILCFDVLIQYLCTISISEGFDPAEVYEEVKSTYCYADVTPGEWQQLLYHIVSGGVALQQYDEYKKVEVGEDGLYRMKNRRMAMRHRMHIGTIVSDPMLKVKFLAGGYIGIIEEWFISRLEPGDVFTLAGRNLELVMIKDLTVLVRKSSSKKSIVPSWQGGRMPLSSNLGMMLRRKFNEAFTNPEDIELKVLSPLFEKQEQLSHVPAANELLVEQIETKDGFHLFVYPFEGRLVHEAMAAVLAFRISLITPITFSIAMNDYGFELLSDQPIPVDDSNVYDLFTTENLFADIQRSVNSTEMARRKFRDIAVIGGLIFQGYPGEHKKARHLQSSASLLFNVFSEYDADNLLVRQAFNEVMEQQMEEQRLRDMLERIQQSKIVLTFPTQLTPFCFPIKVDSMRENMSSEKLEDRIKKMQAQLN